MLAKIEFEQFLELLLLSSDTAYKVQGCSVVLQFLEVAFRINYIR